MLNRGFQRDALDCIYPWGRNWEPRTKTISALLVVIGVVSLNSPVLVAITLGLSICAALVMGVPIGFLLSRLAVLIPFLLFMAVPIIFGAGLSLDPQRVYFASLLVLKALTSVTVMLMLLVSQSAQDFLDGLAHLKIPKVLISVLFLAYRYAHLFIVDLRITKKALESRLYKPGINRKSLPVYGDIFGGMLIRSIDRSEHVYKAMASRGYGGNIFVGYPRAVTFSDMVKTTIPVVVVALLMVIDWVVF